MRIGREELANLDRLAMFLLATLKNIKRVKTGNECKKIGAMRDSNENESESTPATDVAVFNN
jgi:hypothetical protein